MTVGTVFDSQIIISEIAMLRQKSCAGFASRLRAPALKRMIERETFTGALKRSFPCINARAPTEMLQGSHWNLARPPTEI
jgi:hypothetical protein